MSRYSDEFFRFTLGVNGDAFDLHPRPLSEQLSADLVEAYRKGSHFTSIYCACEEWLSLVTTCMEPTVSESTNRRIHGIIEDGSTIKKLFFENMPGPDEEWLFDRKLLDVINHARAQQTGPFRLEPDPYDLFRMPTLQCCESDDFQSAFSFVNVLYRVFKREILRSFTELPDYASEPDNSGEKKISYLTLRDGLNYIYGRVVSLPFVYPSKIYSELQRECVAVQRRRQASESWGSMSLDETESTSLDEKDASPSDSVSTQKLDQAFEFIKKNGPVIGPKIADDIGVATSTFGRHYAEKLRTKGVTNIRGRGGGYYLPEERIS